MIFKFFPFFDFHKTFKKKQPSLNMARNKEENIYQEEVVETKVDEMSAEEGGFMQ